MLHQCVLHLCDLSVFTISKAYIASFSLIKLWKLIKRLIWSEAKTPAKSVLSLSLLFSIIFLVSIFDIPKDINIYAIYLQITPIYHTYVLPMSKALLARSDWSVFVSLLFFTLLTPSSYAHGALSRAIFPCFLPILPVATFFASLLLVHLLFFDHADRFLLALYTYI